MLTTSQRGALVSQDMLQRSRSAESLFLPLSGCTHMRPQTTSVVSQHAAFHPHSPYQKPWYQGLPHENKPRTPCELHCPGVYKGSTRVVSACQSASPPGPPTPHTHPCIHIAHVERLSTQVPFPIPPHHTLTSASRILSIFLSPSPLDSHWLQGNRAVAPVPRLVTRTHARCHPARISESQ
jgi:hypothetical protein